MGGKYKKSYISLEELEKHNADVKTVIDCLDYAADENNFNFALLHKQLILFKLGKKVTDESPKLDLEFKEEQQPPAATLVRNYQNDRHFKLDTVKIKQFSREHSKELDEATIHIGMSADEYVRSFNALALTIGRDIFFRNGAYKPETEEGRKLLAHELTHVSQNENKEDYRNAEKKELENHTPYAELYAKTWRECRNFVLPMNPVRKELEYAVKAAMNELGAKAHTNKKAKKSL